MKNFNSRSLLFIGVRGGGVVLRTCLDSTVARFPGDACPLRRSEGDVFTEIPKCSWNRIIRVNPLPRGASVGEFMKTRHPRNVEANEICDASFQGQKSHEDLESGIREI
jgi:hypothetical protein